MFDKSAMLKYWFGAVKQKQQKSVLHLFIVNYIVNSFVHWHVHAIGSFKSKIIFIAPATKPFFLVFFLSSDNHLALTESLPFISLWNPDDDDDIYKYIYSTLCTEDTRSHLFVDDKQVVAANVAAVAQTISCVCVSPEFYVIASKYNLLYCM